MAKQKHNNHMITGDAIAVKFIKAIHTDESIDFDITDKSIKECIPKIQLPALNFFKHNPELLNQLEIDAISCCTGTCLVTECYKPLQGFDELLDVLLQYWKQLCNNSQPTELMAKQ